MLFQLGNIPTILHDLSDNIYKQLTKENEIVYNYARH